MKDSPQKKWADRNPDKVRAYRRAFHKKNPDYVRDWKRKHRAEIAAQIRAKKYGISSAEFEALLKEQGSRCGICRNLFLGQYYWGQPCVDHNHTSGRVRGLLCRACNFLLGNARDDQKILQRAIKYLSLFDTNKNQTKKEKP